MDRNICILAASLLFFCACKTPPPPGEQPGCALGFEHIEAGGIYQMVLYFRLEIKNPRSDLLISSIQKWQANINGVEAGSETAQLFIVQAEPPQTAAFQEGIQPIKKTWETRGNADSTIDLALHLDLRNAIESFRPATAQDEDHYRVELTLDLEHRYGTTRTFSGEASTTAVFPRISEPEFTITSIAILQAELINTRFRVNLQINNRNAFPVTLSSFKYELYGDGLFWASGQERDVLHIPARGSAETRLFLLMNFINMKRHLLDEIIALRLVNYRFTGEARVDIAVPWLPYFNMQFDRSGLSEVYE